MELKFAYCGNNEWRGFSSSALVAKIFKAGEEFNAQIRVDERRILTKPGFKTLGSAKTWVIGKGVQYDQ